MHPAMAGDQQVQAYFGSYPQVTGTIFQYGARVIAAQRAWVPRIVAIALQHTAAAVHAVQSAVESAKPECATLVLDNLVYLYTARGLSMESGVTNMEEGAALRLPAVQPGLSTDPQGPRVIKCERKDPV